MVSQEWVYENIFNMSEDEWKKEQFKVINNLKLGFRHEQIESEGNDPIKTGESFGTPHDLKHYLNKVVMMMVVIIHLVKTKVEHLKVGLKELVDLKNLVITKLMKIHLVETR